MPWRFFDLYSLPPPLEKKKKKKRAGGGGGGAIESQIDQISFLLSFVGVLSVCLLLEKAVCPK